MTALASVVAFVLLSVFLVAGAYATVVLDDPSGREPLPADRRRAYVAAVVSALSLVGSITIWYVLRA